MKLVNRIFLFFGALSVISFVQFDAGGVAYDGNNDCSSAPLAGYYCIKKGSKRECPVGCYCDGGIKTAVGETYEGNTIAVKTWCNNHTKYLESYLSDRGIHYCPDDFPTTASAITISKDQCKTKGTPVIYLGGGADCTQDAVPGEFCKTAGSHYKCRPGCYCTGNTKKAAGADIDVGKACEKDNTFYPSRFHPAGVYKCPGNFPFSAEGASSSEGCYKMKSGKQLFYKLVYCSAGKYLPAGKNECEACLLGYRCPGNQPRNPWVAYSDEAQGLIECAEPNAVPNADHTACVSSSGGGNGGNAGCNYTVTYRNNYPISNIASVTANDLRAELSAMNVGEPTERFNAMEKVPTNSDGVNRLVTTQNPQPQTRLCQGDPVTLPNAPTAPNGYTFNGWGCNRGIEHKGPGETFNMPAGNVICTAQWTQSGNGGGNTDCSYKVEFNKGNTAVSGSVAAMTGKCQNDIVYVTTNPSFSWDDHTFDGWSCVNSVNNTSLSISDNHITMPSANVTCTAQWTVDTGGSTGDDPETPVSCTTAGKYWDGDGCITCESGYFCPGNGQHYKCPFDGASTQNKASCVLNLNEPQMEYNKCWLRYWNNAAAYRKCLYGIDLATLPH